MLRNSLYLIHNSKVKCSRYRAGCAQRVGRGIALLFHDRDTRSGWVVSSTPRPYFTHGEDPVPIGQEAGWAPGPVWTGGKSRPTGILSPDLPAHNQSLYRLSYRAHLYITVYQYKYKHAYMSFICIIFQLALNRKVWFLINKCIVHTNWPCSEWCVCRNAGKLPVHPLRMTANSKQNTK